MVIGLTGLIGSGKSTAAKIFKDNGFVIIDADQIGKDVVNQNKELLNKLVKFFGKEILDKNKKLNRGKLASRAFIDNNSRFKLNRAVHPYLLRKLKADLKQYKKLGKDVVIDAALLLDWNLDRICDYVFLIHASEKIRQKRITGRGISIADFKARQKMQLPFRQQRARSDFCLYNQSTEKDLKRKIENRLNKLV